MNDSIVTYFSCDVIVKTVRTILARQGLQVVRSFDLRSALVVHTDCPCPHHGTAHCDCQFIVLLVYGAGETPVVVTLHGRDEQTEMKIVLDATIPPDPRLVAQVTATLMETIRKLSITPIEAETAYVE